MCRSKFCALRFFKITSSACLPLIDLLDGLMAPLIDHETLSI